jgi:2-polyprenyl-3-methyl-5-hydroxy-6-metoxy-1,4-benzoquinol methylase
MKRNLQPELMDDPDLDPRSHRAALRGLARINRLSDAPGPIWGAIRSWSEAGGVSKATMADIASGSGDVLLGVARRALRHGLNLEIHALDISDEALRATSERCRSEHVPVTLHHVDVVAGNLSDLRARFDIVMCSLFLHHLRDEQIESMLRSMSGMIRPGGIIVISDLVRSRIGFFAARAVPKLLTRSRVVHIDAVRSVEGALTREELGVIADRAGLTGYSLSRVWPFRMLMTWQRGHS